MTKFGRFEFGKEEPSEIYEGDRMVLEKGYVKILRGEIDLFDLQIAQITAVVHIEKGQSVRQVETESADRHPSRVRITAS
jgi:hypothetical protein